MIYLSYPYVTAASAAILAVLQMVLMLYVATGRGQYKTGLGDGGHAGLIKRIRIHGNLAENAPVFLILLALVEIGGQWRAYVLPVALVFIIARLCHAIGLTISAGPSVFRFLGVMGTLGSILTLAVLIAISLSHNLGWLPLNVG